MTSFIYLIKNPNRSRAPGYFLILLGIDIAVELWGMVPKQEIIGFILQLILFLVNRKIKAKLQKR